MTLRWRRDGGKLLNFYNKERVQRKIEEPSLAFAAFVRP